MNSEYPYQLVAFLDNEPDIGERVYSGKNGWYPQIALKRRFKVDDMSEKTLLSVLTEYCGSEPSFVVSVGELARPERMPVKVLEVEEKPELMNFHNNFIKLMGKKLQSRYPERDGANYLPHITAEYDDVMVIDVDNFRGRRFTIQKVFLLKDTDDDNSVAYASFDLKRSETV